MTTYYGPYTYADLDPLAQALRDVRQIADIDFERGLYADSACPGVTAGELGDRLADLDELIQAATRASDELHRILRGEGN